ncbi:MAG: DUF5011 domain-containing protein [SAR202 cluster bacterium]|nr:DUF5011 domain-containing protein [SAR202 cluster bacterium]
MTTELSPVVWSSKFLILALVIVLSLGLWLAAVVLADTERLTDIFPGAGSSNPSGLTNVEGTLFFTARDSPRPPGRNPPPPPSGTNGNELWKSDGTTAGTALIKGIFPGSGNSDPFEYTEFDGAIFFNAQDFDTRNRRVPPPPGAKGRELWKSDGTTAGTVLVKDIFPGSGSSVPSEFTESGGTLFFAASNGAGGRQLWKSDGTPAGTVLVKDLGGTQIFGLTAFGGNLVFSTISDLWISDGTAAGTLKLAAGIKPSTPTVVGTTLFVQAFDGANGRELWKSDGTPAGTVLVKDIFPGGANSESESFTDVGDTLFFAANDGITGSGFNGGELWKSDGTAAGTALIKDIRPGLLPSIPYDLTVVGGTLFFRANDGINGFELWKSDGTNAGTLLVKDINPGSGNSFPLNLTSVDGTLFFQADDGTNGVELWKSDGTAAGTVLVEDINIGVGDSKPSEMTAVSGAIFFRADDGIVGAELWKLLIDTTPPVITLLGIDPVNVIEGDIYVDDGATAFDNVDGDITANIVTVNPVDVNIPASYTVTYDVSDAAGNAAVQVTRAVNVVTAGEAAQNIVNLIIDLELPNGVQNSLSAPLNTASTILSDNNTNNDGAACGKLNAFTNQVDAKEGSGKLTQEQADELRQAADAIQDSLECT